MLKIWPCRKKFVSLHCKTKRGCSPLIEKHTVMEFTLSDVIFEPTEADYEFVDALCPEPVSSSRVPSVDEFNAQLEAAEHFDSLEDYFNSSPELRRAGRVLGWLC